MRGDSNSRRNRRAVLRAGLTAGTVVVAGCTGGGGDGGDGGDGDDGGDGSSNSDGGDGGSGDQGPDTGSGPTVEFEDDFEDGDYDSEPAWEFAPPPNDDAEVGKIEVVSRSSPAGGSTGVHLTDMTDDRYPGPTHFSLADPMEGMDGAWTLSGLFSPVEIPDGVDERRNTVSTYWPHDGNFGNRAWLQFRFTEYVADEETQYVRLRTQEQDNRDWKVPAEAEAAALEVDRWYRWELAHDGEGTYVGRRWPADGERSDGVEVSAEFVVPDASVVFDLRVLSGVTADDGSSGAEPGERPYTVDHDFVRRTSE